MTTRIARKGQLTFGGSLLAQDNIAVFGSLKTGVPEYSLDLDAIQTASYLGGWQQAVVNNEAPCLEDMNAMFYLTTKQLGYILQDGIPEWDDGTYYYIGSMVKDTSGSVYVSISNTNLNQALTVAAKWRPIQHVGTVTGSTNDTIALNCQLGSSFYCNGSTSNKTVTITNMADGQSVKMLVGGASPNSITLTANSAAAPGGTSLTIKTVGSAYSPMTSAYSWLKFTRVGGLLLVESTHGIT